MKRRITFLDRCIEQHYHVRKWVSDFPSHPSYPYHKDGGFATALNRHTQLWDTMRPLLFASTQINANNVFLHCFGMETFYIYDPLLTDWDEEDEEKYSGVYPVATHAKDDRPSNDKEWTFFNLIPPFKNTFIEFNRVGSFYETLIDYSYAIHIEREDIDDGYNLRFRSFRDNCFSGFQDIDIDKIDDLILTINEYGLFSGDLKRTIAQQLASHNNENIRWSEYDTLDIFYATLMTLQFLNAKNTELIDNPPPAKLSKRHEKKYGVPLVTYKTLKVNPIRKVNANDYDDDSDGESIPKSLHIARGHFKDYRNGPGLFGKYRDIFWWDAHVRGSAKQGVVVKDYDVQAPDDEGA